MIGEPSPCVLTYRVSSYCLIMEIRHDRRNGTKEL
jgi:hypothetical protein